MASELGLLRAMADTLDGLGIAICVFDDADRTLLWNRSFLKIFPEHAGHIHAGEPYAANLRRFYEGRLGADEMPSIERYIGEGIVRHRAQHRAFAFEHQGVQLSVASLPLPGIGRVRIWKPEGARPPALRIGTVPVDGTALFDHVADGVMVTDAQARILWVNEPFVAMYGLRDRQAAVGLDFGSAYRTAWEGHEAAEQALFESGLSILAEQMRFAGAPFEVPLPGARWSRVTEQHSPDGKGFFAHVDITELKRQQHRLQLAERRARESEAALLQKSALLETTLDRMEQGIMMVNAERVVEVCNRRAIELLGLPPELMARRPTFGEVLAFQWRTDEFAHTPEELLEFIRAGGILDQPHRYDRQRPDGRVIEIQSVPIGGGGVVRTYTDITERRQAEERVRHSARHDSLTGLVNREVFLESLVAATAAAQRTGRGFAVHYIDIDRFKPINDRCGHAVGDQVIALLAGRMRGAADPADVVGRMGGDEFAVLQWNVDAPEAASALAQRVLEHLREPMEIESHRLQVGASVGIALCRAATGVDADMLMRHADTAMYIAKASGSDRACVYSDEARGLHFGR